MTDQKRILDALAQIQPKVAEFAKNAYETDGRGIVVIELPELPPGTATFGVTDIVYQTLETLRSETVDMVGAQGEDRDITIRMIESYDPTRQAVVMLAIGDSLPVTVKMKLTVPVIADEPGGVH